MHLKEHTDMSSQHIHGMMLQSCLLADMCARTMATDYSRIHKEMVPQGRKEREMEGVWAVLTMTVEVML